MSLKARLLVGMGLVALLLVVAALTVTRVTTSYLVGQVDNQLQRFARMVEDGPRPPPGQGSPPPPSDGPTAGPDGGDDQFTTLFVGTFDGGELSTRISPAGDHLVPPAPELDEAAALQIAAAGVPRYVGSTIAGTRYRVMVGRDPSGALAVVGLPLDDVDATVSRLVVVEILTSTCVLIVLALITWWVLRLGVRPIRRMTGVAATIAAGDLSERIPDARAGTEAAALGSALNVMLERIEEAFADRAASEDRLRRFVADASHELRTPVTTIRGYAELFRLGGLAEPEQLAAAMRRTEAESARMGQLVDDMLTLARLDEGREIEREPVRLDDVARDVVADLVVVHPDRAVATKLEPVTVLGDRDQLHQVVANLLNNAAEHTAAETPIDVVVTRDGRAGLLVVADRGDGIDDETAAHAFERFYRADPSRSRASGGTGLGLSIVAAIAEAHHGTVRFARPGHGPLPDGVPAGAGTVVVVELPTQD